jgi:hypothetical protein
MLVCVVSLWHAGLSPAALATNDLLDAPGLYRLTIHELEEALAKTERFTALPANVSDILCPPGGNPVFSVPDNENEPTWSQSSTDYVERHGSFCVVRSGGILGASSNEVVLIGRKDLSVPGRPGLAVRDVAIVGERSVRHLPSSRYPQVSKAFSTGSGWGFVLAHGVLLHAATNLDTADVPAKDYPPTVIEGANECAILTRVGSFGGTDQARRLVVTTVARDGTRQEEFPETQEHPLAQQGLVHLGDGRWLSIGSRLIPLQTNRPALPPEQFLTAIVKATRAGDEKALSEALESATIYPREQLRGLVEVLAKEPDVFGNAHAVEANARQSLRAAHAWKPAEGLTPTQQTQAAAAMAAYTKSLERFLAEMTQVREETQMTSPTRIGNLIQNGYQYFAGWWIGQPKVLRQEGLRSSLLDLAFITSTNSVRRGIFRLDERGDLRLLGDFTSALEVKGREPGPFEDRGFFEAPSHAISVGPFSQPCEYAGVDNNGVLLFFPFEGLGRVAAGAFEWVDRSEPFKRMEHLAGADLQGRLYLFSAPAFMSSAKTGTPSTIPGAFSPWAYPVVTGGKGGDLWVYRRNAPTTTSAIHQLFPVVSLPVMDSKQRVWFLALKPSPGSPWPQGPGALGDTPAADVAMKVLQPAIGTNAPPDSAAHLFPADWNASGWTTDLCCYDAGKITVGTTNVPFQTTLTAGASGSVLGYSWTPRVSEAYCLDGSGVLWGASLHELAQRASARLLQAAPMQTSPAGQFVPNYDFSQMDHPAIARTGDHLWVYHNSRLEVYLDGKALGVQQRLTLLNCPANLSLHGPVNTPMGPAMVIVGTAGSGSSRGPASVFWAIPTANDIELVRGPAKDMDFSVEVPLVNPAKGRLYLPRFVSPASFWMVSAPDKVEERLDSGVPIWINLKNQLITQRSTHGYNGWRLEEDDRRRDFPLTYTRKLRVIQETNDGKLVCESPEGVVWLRPNETGDYVPAAEIPLHTGGFVQSFVGETSRELFLTLVDARQNAYLAVLNKR